MKHLRLSAAFLAVILMIVMSFGVVAAQAPEPEIPKPTKEFYVNDFANILDSETERDILSIGENTNKATGGGQVVFVSIDTLNGSTIEEYSNALFNQWKIGTEDKGILFILSMQERESRIEVGYGYEGVLTDIESYKLLEKFALLNKDVGMDAAVKTIYQDISMIVSGEEDSVVYPEVRQEETQSSFFEENPIMTILFAIIIIVLIVIDFALTGGQITFFILRMIAVSSRRGGGGGGFGGGGRNSGGGGRSGGGGASGRF